MNPWLRVLAVFGLAIAAALFLKVLPPVIVLLFFVGGIAAVNLGLKRRVKSERAEFRSEAVGLKRETRDPFGLLGYPFSLFGRCERAAIGEVRWGSWRGLDVKRFDLEGSIRATGEPARFACAIAPSPPVALPMVVEAEVLGRLLSEPPIERVDVMPAGSDPTYVVRCDDQTMARALIGAPIVEWLEGLEEPWGFEVNGSLALVYGPPSTGVEEPLERLERFVELLAVAVPEPGLGEPDRAS